MIYEHFRFASTFYWTQYLTDAYLSFWLFGVLLLIVDKSSANTIGYICSPKHNKNKYLFVFGVRHTGLGGIAK